MPFLKQDPLLPPGQRRATKFPVLHAGPVPAIDPGAWRLHVFGEVDEPYVLTLEELHALPAADWQGDIHCVTRWTLPGSRWRGVRLAELIARAVPRAHASFVLQHAANDYTTGLPLHVMREANVLVAYAYDGAPLEPIHGGPVRMLVPSRYFWKSAKWLHGIELLRDPVEGFWEKRGYHANGDPMREERYARPPSWFE